MAKKVRRQSYFEEQVMRAHDPMFFKAMLDEDIRRQVPRIVRDIRNCNIPDQYLNYLTQDRIISACIYVAQGQYNNALITVKALQFYIEKELTPQKIYANVDLNVERQRASNLLSIATNKMLVWDACCRMFDGIQRGYDIKYMLGFILVLDQNMFKNI